MQFLLDFYHSCFVRVSAKPQVNALLSIAMTIAYLWLMQMGNLVVTQGKTKQVDNKGAQRSVSLCQIGLRWLQELIAEGVSPPILTASFEEVWDA
jgi:hypothetical protein